MSTKEQKIAHKKFTKSLLQNIQEFLDKNSPEVRSSDEMKNIYVNMYNESGKVFIKRNSLFIKIYEDPNIASLYNILFSIFAFSSIFTIMKYFKGDIDFLFQLHLNYWIKNSAFSLSMTWLKIFIYSFLVYPISYFYCSSSGKATFIWLTFYALYLMHFCYYCCSIMIELHPSPFSSLVLTVENTRLMMKIHSFFRENIRLCNCKDRKFPSISKYLYFSFAPTLIYRDNYPRNKRVRWMVFLENFGTWLLCSYFFCIIIENYLIFPKTSLLKNPISLENIITEVLGNVIPGTFILLLIFYSFLHAWLNAWAELLRFGDRFFYADWWTVTNYGEYYKMWNIVVQDWLRTYLFNELRFLLPSRIKNTLSAMFVIVFSALVHEYIMSMITKSFCPVIMITFGFFGLMLKFFIPKDKANTEFKNTLNLLFWLSFMLGGGILVTFYSREMQVSNHCPRKPQSYLGYFMPRIFDASCYISS